MPTDVTEIWARKSAARAQTQNDILLLLMCCIVALGELMLLFASPTLAEAMALIGSY